MLSDHDPNKWDYPAHTKKKHAILIRYMKAWLSILGQGARRAGYRAHLTIVDAFAGRGRYTTDDPGSPLLLRDIAGRVITDDRVDNVDLIYIENDPDNCAALADELREAGSVSGVIESGPYRDTFEKVAPRVIELLRSTGNASFWFIDPFGYAGVPLDLVQHILHLRRAEVFITLMVRDMRRFLDSPPHQQAIARMMNLYGTELADAIDRVKRADDGAQALRDVYVERLESVGGAGTFLYVISVRVAEDGPGDTVYYLIHASSDAKGKREMKKAIFEATGGLNAVYGAKDPTEIFEATGQVAMFSPAEEREQRIDYAGLRQLLRVKFAGRCVEYEGLQDEVAADHAFDSFADLYVKRVLEELADRHVIIRYRHGRPSSRKLARGDQVEFPEA